MTKKTGFSISKTGQAVFLASALLIAFAVFLSQASPLFLNAAAASSNIRGTLVLTDKSAFSTPTNGRVFVPSNVVSVIALPGTSCSVQVAACNQLQNVIGDANVLQSTPELFFGGTPGNPTILRTASPASSVTDGPGTVQEVCVTSEIVPNIPGGINVVGARNQRFNAVPNVQSLTVAYDCTP